MNMLANTTLMEASHQWATRPADERYTSLYEMQAHFEAEHARSKAVVKSIASLKFVPHETDFKGLVVAGQERDDYGSGFAPTHWAFGQLCGLSKAPASYLRKLPTPIVADALNYSIRYLRDVEDIGMLLYKNGSNVIRAASGPGYGRIWNDDILAGLTKVFGDGVSGTWRVPGFFGVKLDEVTKENTTLFAGDRDMFVFLADEDNRIEIPNRRDGKSGSLARGFFVCNSEVGSKKFYIKTFLFDYVCCNRIVWGATDVQEISMRHTKSAPLRFMQEIAPALASYSQSSATSVVAQIEAARSKSIAHEADDVGEWLAKRFTKALADKMSLVHVLEEGRPIETLWDATVAITAVARGVEWQDDRVALETMGGELLDLATA